MALRKERRSLRVKASVKPARDLTTFRIRVPKTSRILESYRLVSLLASENLLAGSKMTFVNNLHVLQISKPTWESRSFSQPQKCFFSHRKVKLMQPSDFSAATKQAKHITSLLAATALLCTLNFLHYVSFTRNHSPSLAIN